MRQLAAAIIARVATGEPVESVGDVAAAWQSCGGWRSDLSTAGHIDLYTAQ